MSVNISPIGGAAAQFFDNNGNPLSGGKLYTYAAGTTTPLAVYTTSAGNVAHTNPIILDSAGRVPGGQIWLTDGSVDYKFLLETSFSVLVGTFDNIPPAISGTAADIVYLPAGAGAVATTVQAKLRGQDYDITDFGAVSGADSTNAIANCMAVANGTRGTVYFPRGTWITTKAIQIGSGVYVKGAGNTATNVVRTNIVAETINGISYTTIFLFTGGSWMGLSDMAISGSESYGVTTGNLSGVTFGELSAKGHIKDVAINYCLKGITERVGVFLFEFTNIQIVSSGSGFDFYSANQKTSLVLKDCYCANTGNPYFFNLVDYSTLISCAADECNIAGTGGPYNIGPFGAQDTITGVYQFLLSDVTMIGCGAEGCYGNGVVNIISSTVTVTGMFSFGCKSTFQPDYAAFPNYAVGPIQTNTASCSLVVDSFFNREWSNSYVAANFPAKPIAGLVAFNYDEAVLGVLLSQQVIVNGSSVQNGVTTDALLIQGDPAIWPKYCATSHQLRYNPRLAGVISLPPETGTLKKIAVNAKTLTGTGTKITIPIVPQGDASFVHMITIKGIDGTFNSPNALPFMSTIAFGATTVPIIITSSNAVGIASVADVGAALVITLSASHTDPIVDLEIISGRISLINYAAMTLTS